MLGGVNANIVAGFICLVLGLAGLFGLVWAMMRAGKARSTGAVLLWAAVALALLCFSGCSGCFAALAFSG